MNKKEIILAEYKNKFENIKNNDSISETMKINKLLEIKEEMIKDRSALEHGNSLYISICVYINSLKPKIKDEYDLAAISYQENNIKIVFIKYMKINTIVY